MLKGHETLRVELPWYFLVCFQSAYKNGPKCHAVFLYSWRLIHPEQTHFWTSPSSSCFTEHMFSFAWAAVNIFLLFHTRSQVGDSSGFTCSSRCSSRCSSVPAACSSSERFWCCLGITWRCSLSIVCVLPKTDSGGFLEMITVSESQVAQTFKQWWASASSSLIFTVSRMKANETSETFPEQTRRVCSSDLRGGCSAPQQAIAAFPVPPAAMQPRWPRKRSAPL